MRDHDPILHAVKDHPRFSTGPDPKLQEAAGEVRDILNKHDIAGVVVLCSGEKAEFVNHIFRGDGIGPSWSCVYPEGERGGVHLKADGRKDHVGRHSINMTAKAVFTFRDLLAIEWDMFETICNAFASRFRIKAGDSEIIPGPDNEGP